MIKGYSVIWDTKHGWDMDESFDTLREAFARYSTLEAPYKELAYDDTHEGTRTLLNSKGTDNLSRYGFLPCDWDSFPAKLTWREKTGSRCEAWYRNHHIIAEELFLFGWEAVIEDPDHKEVKHLYHGTSRDNIGYKAACFVDELCRQRDEGRRD